MKAKPAGKPSAIGADAVDAFMAELKHPLKAEIGALRALMTELDPRIAEEVKWNAPGFRTTESFATVNLRSRDRLQMVFHLGAKVRKPPPELVIADPAGLMKWLGKDRALVTMGAGRDFSVRRQALEAIVRAWIACV